MGAQNANLTRVVVALEVARGGPLPCRVRPGDAAELGPQACDGCPALATVCGGRLVRTPGLLGWYGSETTDPLSRRRRWLRSKMRGTA